ncbi:MAG TPA: MtrB/PioB family outer membrane beta-barrel protein, partial [Methylomirabilota bacterium]|nr:MtrB/PioB family outer membrane beta-barrel protein [Methylomirabilota bacterium]
MRAPAAVRLAVVLAAVSWLALPAAAQIPVGGFTLEGEVATGVRYYLLEPSDSRKGKFEEYRDLPEWLFLAGVRLRLARPDDSYAIELGGANWGQDDQEYFLGVGRVGVWQLGFEWDEIQHIYSTTGRTLANEAQRGVWALPTPRVNLSNHNAGRRIDEISQHWDVARLFLDLTPTPELDVRAEYM